MMHANYKDEAKKLYETAEKEAQAILALVEARN